MVALGIRPILRDSVLSKFGRYSRVWLSELTELLSREEVYRVHAHVASSTAAPPVKAPTSPVKLVAMPVTTSPGPVLAVAVCPRQRLVAVVLSKLMHDRVGTGRVFAVVQLHSLVDAAMVHSSEYVWEGENHRFVSVTDGGVCFADDGR